VAPTGSSPSALSGWSRQLVWHQVSRLAGIGGFVQASMVT
jgi:hypothetical protein